MSEINSTPSSDNIKQADNTNNNTAPDMNKQTDIANEITHGYFIPVVMMIVLGVVIVATFYSKEFNSLLASAASPDPDDSHTKVKQQLLARTVTSDNSEETAKSSVIIEAAASGSTLTTTDTPSSEPVPANTSSAEFRIAAAQDDPVSYTDTQNRVASPHAVPMPYDMPEHYQQFRNELMEHRRRAHEQAVQARREHMKKMHEYRTAVRERIKQDRLDRFVRVQEIGQESQGRIDVQMGRREQAVKRSMNRPI